MKGPWVHDVYSYCSYLYILKLRFSLSRRPRLRLCDPSIYLIISYFTIFIHNYMTNYSIVNNYNSYVMNGIKYCVLLL